MNRTSCSIAIAILALLLRGQVALAQSVAYCNIVSVEAHQLSNGVQVTVKADGVIDWQPENNDWGMIYGGPARRIALRFTNAKSQVGRNFIDVSKFPVAYLQLSVPQDAKQGVGVSLVVALFEPSRINIEKSSDQQSVIITVNSERTLVSRAAGTSDAGAGAASATSQMQVEYAGGVLSVYAVKAKILPLLAEIARKTGANIAVDDSVKDRQVTTVLDGLSVDDVLKDIAAAYGLAMSQVNGVTMVSDGVPVDLATYRLSSTESFRMNYIKGQTASELLPTFLYSYLHVNEAQNAVVVTAPGQMLDKIRADFRKIDIAPPQIMIDALAVEVSSTEDLNASLGLLAQFKPLTASSDSATGDIRYSTVGMLPRDFQATLQALVASGKARVRANPRMAAINGQSADIFIGQTKFIKVEVTSYGGKQERIQGVDVGVKLGVRPWTGGNGEITVWLAPEVSNISELDRETGMPVLSTRRASTTVRVKDGETVVIGGLVQRQEYRTRSKVPLLGDIPLLGLAFRSTKTSSTNSELVIFLTPHVLTDRGRLSDEAAEMETRQKLLDEGRR